ncbi:hypothetical protein FJZ36_12040 [Candidatus Poribacteria bacterium]|nr:hypothetical protein [Candidatus Poribacteria bacterium]
MVFRCDLSWVRNRHVLTCAAMMACAVLAGCRPSEAPQSPVVAEIALATDDDLLRIVDRLPFGLSYRDVKLRLPAMGEIHPDGHSEQSIAQSLFEASMPVRLLRQDASLELNFGSGGLYSYYYWVTELDLTPADNLVSAVEAYYTELYGKPRHLDGNQPIWILDTSRLIIRQFEWNGTQVVQFGFEQRGT